LGITSSPTYRIKGVPRPGHVEFKAVAEILYKHEGPAFRAFISDVVADAT
jgi:hypothetical protein